LLSAPPRVELSAFTTFASGLDHPECVATDRHGTVYAGGEAGQIYRISEDGEVAELASTEGLILGLAVDGNGNVFACDMVNKAVMRIEPSGSVARFAAGTSDQPMANPNFPAFDEGGRLYVSDSGTFGANDGCLWVVTRDGECRIASTEPSEFPNGLALSADRESLYVVLSTLPGIGRLAIADGEVRGGLEVIAVLPPETVPDGVVVLESGELVVSCWAPDALFLVDRAGDVQLLAWDPIHAVLACPTNVTFAEDRTAMVIANFGGWHLSRISTDWVGAEPCYPVV
jgi:gluconolactonase